jgi:RNA polymerase sigma-70 factor, ECF subfamily
VRRRDPLANPEPLIRRVYSYAAYRLGDGPDAEDATSEVFERALRYRQSYDESRGLPEQWLIGIARRCVDDALAARRVAPAQQPDDLTPAPGDVESDTVRRLAVAAAIVTLDDRARDLLALRYGADLTARQIGELLELKTNAVEVALHRTLQRLKQQLEDPDAPARAAGGEHAPETAA